MKTYKSPYSKNLTPDRAKIKESSRPKFKLENFDVIKDFESLYNFLKINNYSMAENELFPEIKENLPEGKVSLYTFLKQNSILINKYMASDAVIIKTHKTSIAALMLRIERLKIRLTLITMLFAKTKVNPIALKLKYKLLIENMQKKVIMIDYKNSKNAFTFESTLALLVKELIIVDQSARDIVFSLRGSFNVLPIRSTRLTGSVYSAIIAIAPSDLSQLEPDYHYVWTLFLQGENPPLFYLLPTANASKPSLIEDQANLNSQMLLQWRTYYKEISCLFDFLSLPELQSNPATYDFSMLMSSPLTENIINKPFSTFLTTPCSANTFSRIISCASHLVPLVYLHIIKCILVNFKH